MKRVNRKNAGITLLELMFAAGVMAVALSMLFGSLIGINLMGEVAEGRSRASTVMSSVLEEVRASNFNTILEFAPTPITHPGVTIVVQLEVVDEDGNLTQVPLAEDAEVNFPNPAEIKATVVWTTPRGRAYSMTSSTMKGR